MADKTFEVSTLPPKHARFVAEYLIDLNATRAYRTVYGGAQSTAETNGTRLLGNARVAEAIREGKAAQLRTAEISAARVLEELRRLAFGDRTKLLRCKTIADVEALPDELRALVLDFEIFEANVRGVRDGKTDRVRRVRMVPKTPSIEMLARHLKLLGGETEEQGTIKELLARLDRGRERNRERNAARRNRKKD